MERVSKRDLLNTVFRSSESKCVIEPQDINESLQFNDSSEDFTDPNRQQNFVPLPLKSADSHSVRSLCSTTNNPFKSQFEYEYPLESLDISHESEMLANYKYNDRTNDGSNTSDSLEYHCINLYEQYNTLIDNLPTCSRNKRPPTELIDKQLHLSSFLPKCLNSGLRISHSTPIRRGDMSPEMSSLNSTDSENSLFSSPSQILAQGREKQTTIMKSFSQSDSFMNYCGTYSDFLKSADPCVGQVVAKKTRVPYTVEQYSILNEFFRKSDGYLRPADIDCIMMMTGLKRKQIRKYFANKRNRNYKKSPY